MIRKVILCLLALGLLVAVGYTVYAGMLGIPSYQQIDEKSKKLDSAIQTYEDKNNVQLKSRQKAIGSQIENYKKQKEEYEQLLQEKQNQQQEIDSANCYDIDFLWTIVGNFATNRGVTLNFDVTKNLSDAGKSEYVLTDLNFSVSGAYNDIADYIRDLERDDRLEFEIRNIQMKMDEEKNGKGTSDNSVNNKKVLRADFVVYGIAINKATLTDLNTKTTEVAQPVGDTTTATEVSNTTSAAVSNTSAGF